MIPSLVFWKVIPSEIYYMGYDRRRGQHWRDRMQGLSSGDSELCDDRTEVDVHGSRQNYLISNYDIREFDIAVSSTGIYCRLDRNLNCLRSHRRLTTYSWFRLVTFSVVLAGWVTV